MPLQNRVTPLGELVADPARGLVYGNRGCLHDAEGRIRRRYAGKRWIACRLEFRGRRRTRLLQPGRYTELFFLDEATAFAAGHRPCAECRREDYVRFQAALARARPRAGERGRDRRAAPRRAARAAASSGTTTRALDELPGRRVRAASTARRGSCRRASCCVEPCRVRGADAAARPRAPATLITPPSLVAVLRAGWEPGRAARAPDGGWSPHDDRLAGSTSARCKHAGGRRVANRPRASSCIDRYATSLGRAAAAAAARRDVGRGVLRRSTRRRACRRSGDTRRAADRGGTDADERPARPARRRRGDARSGPFVEAWAHIFGPATSSRCPLSRRTRAS